MARHVTTAISASHELPRLPRRDQGAVTPTSCQRYAMMRLVMRGSTKVNGHNSTTAEQANGSRSPSAVNFDEML